MKVQRPTQRAGRTRLAAALCTAGLVAGTLGSNLVGAGAQDPPVPGESVAAAPTQVDADTQVPPAAQGPAAAGAAAASDKAATAARLSERSLRKMTPRVVWLHL